jgi:arylsulfatase A-like enzyme
MILLAMAALTAATPAPNIITILTDDQGFGDSSYNCENSTGMCARTPNLDALALSPNTALFSRFYSAAGVCSPTRAAYLTGRTNERDCIHFALTCDGENPADKCSMGKGLPWSEFTTAKAAKKSTKGNYSTIMIGKW